MNTEYRDSTLGGAQPESWPRARAAGRQVVEFLRKIFPGLRRRELEEEQRKHRERQRREEEQRRSESNDHQQELGQELGQEQGQEQGSAAQRARDAEAAKCQPRGQEVTDALEALRQELAEAAQPPAGRRTSASPFGDEHSGPKPASPSAQAAQAAESIREDLEDAVASEIGGFGSRGRSGLEVHFHPTERAIRTVRGPKRAAEKGMAITRIDRLAVDGMVFDRRRPGGSILVDHSGSMSLSFDEVAQAIEQFPAVTIGRYSGPRSWGTSEYGTLCILAENGQLGEIGDCQVGGGGNDVDIEALVWLGKQPEPRVWVSDGAVCGGLVETLGPKQAFEVITTLCRRKGIVRVDTFEEAVQVLQRGASRGTATRASDPDFVPRLAQEQ